MRKRLMNWRFKAWVAKDRPRLRAFVKLTPVIFLAGLMMISNIPALSEFFGFSLDILIIAPLATILACIVAWITCRISLNRSIDAALENVKEMLIVFFILMMAYAMADIFMATGVGASIISLSLKVGLSARSVALVSFLVSALLSTATGTSWGTFAATAPIFLWLAHITDANVYLTMAAIAGGSCFGDNLGLISDTTVVSSGIHRIEVSERMRYQWAWSLLCLVVASALFYISSMSLSAAPVDGSTALSTIPNDVMLTLEVERPAAVQLLQQVEQGVPFYLVLPIIIVIVTAFLKVPTLLCLLAGIISAYILGMIAGTITSTLNFMTMLQNGFSSAGSWVIIMMIWVGAFGGIMSKMDAFRPFANLAFKMSKKVRHLMFWNGMLSFLGNAALADEMAQIVTIGPITRDITDDAVEGSEEDMEKLRFRNATFSSALGIFGSQFIPWHVFVNYFLSISASIYPLAEFTFANLFKYNYMAMVTVATLLFMTITGTDKFLPNFRMPREPQVKLVEKLPEKPMYY